MTPPQTERLLFHDMEPEQSNFHNDIINGLNSKPRNIRTEIAIINDNLEDICGHLGKKCVLIEPGSGASKKVRLLLDELEPHTYIPMDISSDYLYSVALDLASEYPKLKVIAACVDFTAPIKLPEYPIHKRRVAFFPGSSIGNFEPEEAIVFLKNLRTLVQADGGLLIGVDLKKDPHILNNAYNDKQGVTAQFNLNVLAHINRKLDANFNFDCFKHKAFYNESLGRVEMHLLCKNSQSVTIGNNVFNIKHGESIHTENSYKYSSAEFSNLAMRAGFKHEKTWLDDNELFSIHYLSAV